jgi:membrane protease YdiL (CAAX protease family)
MTKQEAKKRLVAVLSWVIILFGLMPFIKVEWASTYDLSGVLVMLAVIYALVVIYGLGVFLQTIARIKPNQPKLKVLKFILIRFYHIFFWPISFGWDALKSTYFVLRGK